MTDEATQVYAAPYPKLTTLKYPGISTSTEEA